MSTKQEITKPYTYSQEMTQFVVGMIVLFITVYFMFRDFFPSQIYIIPLNFGIFTLTCLVFYKDLPWVKSKQKKVTEPIIVNNTNLNEIK